MNFVIMGSRDSYYYIKNQKTYQYLLKNGEVAEYRDIGEGVNGWFETYEEAVKVLSEYKSNEKSNRIS
jgi:hypothetical protein